MHHRLRDGPFAGVTVESLSADLVLALRTPWMGRPEARLSTTAVSVIGLDGKSVSRKIGVSAFVQRLRI